MALDLTLYPGGDLVQKGLSDLEAGKETDEALLVLVMRPRLVSLGFVVPQRDGLPVPIDHLLYERLEDRVGVGAHAAHNALMLRICSFANAYSPPARKVAS